MFEKLNKLLDRNAPSNACEPCLPRSHQEMLADHQARHRRIERENRRHERRFLG